jgi:hypothetical protein
MAVEVLMQEHRNLDSSRVTAAAIRTAKWATTMTKWRIGFETGGKRLAKAGVKPSRRWQLVGFPGPAGRESAGIVDLMAIRKDHATGNGDFRRGDLFEIILIQIKGGGARWPSADDIRRLRAVARRYRAKHVILAEWVKGSHQKFYKLHKSISDPKTAWIEVDPGMIFC